MTVFEILNSKAKEMDTDVLIEELEKAKRSDSQAAIEKEIVERSTCPECGNGLLSQGDSLYCPLDGFEFELSKDVSEYERI